VSNVPADSTGRTALLALFGCSQSRADRGEEPASLAIADSFSACRHRLS